MMTGDKSGLQGYDEKQVQMMEENCIVVDKDDKLIGTLTDGDIRRSILAGKKFNDNISSSYTWKVEESYEENIPTNYALGFSYSKFQPL